MNSTLAQPKRRITFINRSYWPDCEATGQLLTELCEDLAGTFDVCVICGQPNSNPDGEAFKRWGTSYRNGVTIRRICHTQFGKNRRRRWRAINMLSFFIGATLSALLGPKPEILVTETDPPLLCFLGVLMKRVRRCKFALYLQDIYPDVADAMGQLPGWFPTNLVRKIFYAAYRRADTVIVLSRDMREFLVSVGVSPERVHIVPNWVDTREVVPIKENNKFRRDHGLEDQFVVMYSGNMGLSQPLEMIIDAAEQLADRTDITFALVGDGARRKQLEEEVRRRGLANVRFFDYQPKRWLSQSLSAADLHVVFLEPVLVPFMMPSKVYSILATGTPVLAVTDPTSELGTLVADDGLGKVCPVAEIRQFVRQIEAFADSFVAPSSSLHARDLCQAHFDRTSAPQKIVDCIDDRPIPVDREVSPFSVPSATQACR